MMLPSNSLPANGAGYGTTCNFEWQVTSDK
jgi:hypothetical protein